MSLRRPVRFSAMVPAKRRVSFTARGKKVSFTATVPTKRTVTFLARVKKVQHLGETKKVQVGHPTKNDWVDLKAVPGQLESGLSVIADIVTLISILGIFGAFGFNIFGLVIALAYLGAWEIVGVGFSSIESRLPRPIRRLWRIAQHLVNIFFG